MMSDSGFKAINDLDLDPIKVKLMHKESGEGWSLEKANAVEAEYRRFLILMKKFPTEQTAPLFDVDTFWHYHILDTMKYATDCEAVFGYFLHHFPYIGLRGEDDEAAHQRIGARMKELYEETFGEPYIRAEGESQTAWSASAVQTAWSASPAKAQTAWSASASPVNALTAWSASPAKAVTAWSASASPVNGLTAWSASASPVNGVTAWSASASPAKAEAAEVQRFYSERPALKQAA
jgi:hypothetical protein